ncbi:MAG: hypothetical protein ABIJ31_11105 [Pseudomonadota bacterium]
MNGPWLKKPLRTLAKGTRMLMKIYDLDDLRCEKYIGMEQALELLLLTPL